VKVTKLDGDPPGLRDMLVRAGYPKLAKDLCDDHHQTGPTYVAVSDTVVGLLEGRFNCEYDERYAPAAHPGPQAWIFNIVVYPGCRRLGIGSLLIKEFVADAAEAGCTYVALEVNLQHGDGLPGRLAFFSRSGFVVLATIANLPEIMGAPIAVLNETRPMSS
jgi:ribosomal protein S18 acetylase RimI-like enzyme